MSRKSVIVCRSAEEMEHKADALMERGFRVETETDVFPVPGKCVTTYRVVFWKK